MNDLVRVYPIRFSRDEWNIKLYCYHNCTERCSKIYQRDVFPNEDNYYLTDNPDYVDNKCLFFNKNVGCILKVKCPAFWDLPKVEDKE